MKGGIKMFKGKRTYGFIIATVIVAVISVLEGAVIVSPELTAAGITFLGALAVYFRHQA